MIQKLVRLHDDVELAPTIPTIPPEGEYISVVADVYTTEIIPVGNGKELAHVIQYSLLNLKNYQQYMFYETISPYKSTPRTEAFIEMLSRYGLDFFPDDSIIGLVEKIDIVYDFVNGYAVPIISKRRRMFVDEDVDIVRDITLPF